MEYSQDPVKVEEFQSHHFFGPISPTHSGYEWNDSQSSTWSSGHWGYQRCDTPDYYHGSPKTPPAGKFVSIQPRTGDATTQQTQRLYLPPTPRRKGNNRYGQSGSLRCMRCQKGKRKCVYSTKDEPCQRCVERGFPDCGEKLPTPRKQLALRQLQESGYVFSDSDETSSRGSMDSCPSRQSSSGPLLPTLNLEALRDYSSTHPDDEALLKLWKHLTI